MRPGVNVTVTDAVPPRSQATDVDVFFVAGLAEKGPSTATLIRNMSDYTRYFGTRQSYADLYDILDAYFREGGSRAYVARIVGDVPTFAAVTLDDSAAADTVTVRAKSAGAYGAALNVAVVDAGGGAVRLVVTSDDDATIIETSPDFDTRAELLEWTGSDYITLVAAGTSVLLPEPVAATGLTGGDADLDTVDTGSYVAILTAFTKGLGPGQVALPGQTDATVQAALLAHAAANNRVALLDAPDSATAGTLSASSLALRTNANARYGGMFGPKARIPGITPGTTREMWWSVIQAGMMARNANPNLAAAGVRGESRLAIEPKYEYTDAERETLNEAGVNIARMLYGAVRTYGFRTLVNPNTLPSWIQLNNVRTFMSIKAQADLIGENYVFENIDGRGISIGAFGGELAGMLVPYWESGALYGRNVEEAFFVDVGSGVNTPETIANGELRANLAVRTSPFAEMVNIEIIKMPLPTSLENSPLATA